jgi:predicted dehydrogenase
LDEGLLGTLFTLHQERAKLGRVRLGEDALWSLGVHDIAVLLHLVGSSPHEVRRVGHAGLNPGIADDVYVHLAFQDGVRATLHNSWLWPEDSRVLRVIGSRGMIEYREKTQTVTLFRKWADPSGQHHDDGSEVLFQGSAQPLRLELEHFIDCIQTRSTPLSDGKNGLEVIRVLEQASAV